MSLRGRVSSHVDDLDELHHTHPWVPGRTQIRPNEETRARKAAFLTNIQQRYHSPRHMLLHRIFQLPTSPHPTSRQLWVSPENVGEATYRLTENRFPYDVSPMTEHLVLWVLLSSDQPRSAFTDERITEIVSNSLGDDCEFVWYSNPKPTFASLSTFSLPGDSTTHAKEEEKEDIFHVQVFRRKA